MGDEVCPGKINSFRDLRVWQLGMKLVEEVYLLTRVFPKAETYGLGNQARRAAVSIPSNIAEGHAREHLKEYLNHISISQGSLAELQTQMEIAARLGYVQEEELSSFREHAVSLAKQLHALRNALSVKVRSTVIGSPSPNT